MRRILAVVILLAAVGCEPAPAPPPPPPTTVDPLAAVVAEVWAPGSVPRGANVTWQIGTPPVPYAAWTSWSCILTFCLFTVTVAPNAITPAIVAHEGGHIVCMSSWWDSSELCADTVARQMGY
jgi:hypothetical protein